MKIVIDISQIVYEGTGVATYTRNIVRELLKLNKNNRHQYLLFGTSLRQRARLESFISSLENEGLNFDHFFLSLPPTFTDLIWNRIHHVKLEKLIGKFDLLHSSDWVQPPTRAKKVTTIHDMIVYKYPQTSTNRFGFNLEKLSPIANIVQTQKDRLKWVQKEADLILADSLSTKRDIVEILKIPSARIRTIYLAAGDNFEEFRKQSVKEKVARVQKVRNKYHLGRDYILAVGTQEPRKNLKTLIAAFTKLSDVKTDLVIAGKFGWGQRDEHKDNSAIKILGYVPQDDLPALYAGAKLFAYPTLYEGFGVPILEAFSAGTPVLTSNLSSHPEVGGKATIYVNPEDVGSIAKQISGLLKLSQTLRQKMIEKGYRQLGLFSWEKAAQETLAAYESLG